MNAVSTTDFPSQKMQWMWKDQLSSDERWECFEDVANMIIEEAYQANETHAVLDWCYLDFSQMILTLDVHINNKRPVKRVTRNHESHYNHRDTIFMNNYLVEASTVNRPGAFGDFIWEAYLLGQWRDVSQVVLVERAAQGIIEELKICGRKKQGEWMAKHLLEVKHGTRKQIWRRCVHLYTLESLLYETLNNTLRMVNSEEHKQNWRDRLHTLGLFAWFLFDFPQDTDEFEGYIYKGFESSIQGIDSFKIAAETGELLAFPTFTSTSRNRSVAEKFGDTLLIISMLRSRETSVDVSALSHYPKEEEQLLIPGFLFKVTRAEYDSTTKKHFVYLQDCNNQ